MSVAAFAEARDFLLTHRTDYATAYAGFAWPRMETFNWALDWFDGVLARGELADKPALRITGAGAAELSFAELSERSSRVANGLRTMGVSRGDRILVMLGNVVPLWEVMLAAMKLGAVVVPATTLLTADDLAERVARARVRFVVCAAEDAAKLAGVDVPRITVGGAAPGCTDYAMLLTGAADFVADGETRADDPLLLYFTSGTTAKPKLVLHSHSSYPVGHLSTMYWLGLQPGDMHLNVSSPGWAKHAWSCLFAPWNAGAGVFIHNQPRFNAKGLLDAIVAGGVTTLCAPPTVWRMMIQEDLAAWKTGLREVCGAGEPLNPEVIDRVRAAWGMTIRDGYGQTETTAQIGNPPGQIVKPGSMGRPLPGYRIRLVDTDDRDAAEGAVCIALDARPASLMRGYQQDDGGILPVTGDVYRTGDVASRDADGYLTYVGRADDIFKASDYRISPFELESVLIEHPLVAEAAVVPAPDALRLAVPKAYVSLVGGAEPSPEVAASIFAHLRARLAPYKRIRRLEFAELPKTISGKIRRVELRRAEEARTVRAPDEFREEDFPEIASQGSAS
jgi:acetyl-CoA synthetase